MGARKNRGPTSPGAIESSASLIVAELLDMSADEADRAMAAVAAITGDAGALKFYTERIEAREDADNDDIDAETRAAVHKAIGGIGVSRG
jgi:hypothetical protein